MNIGSHLLPWCFKAFRELTKKDRFGHYVDEQLLLQWCNIYNIILEEQYGLTTVRCVDCRKISSRGCPVKKLKLLFDKPKKHNYYCKKCALKIKDWQGKAANVLRTMIINEQAMVNHRDTKELLSLIG